MEEIPAYPLDPNLKTLPPDEWHVESCGDNAVAIGAWIDADERLHWRVFRFGTHAATIFGFGTRGPKLYGSNEQIVTPIGDGGNKFYLLPDGPSVTHIHDA